MGGGGYRLIERVGKVKALQMIAMSQVLSAAALTLDLDAATNSVDKLLEENKEIDETAPTFTRLMTWLHHENEGSLEKQTFSSTWGAGEHRSALGLPTGMSKTDT